MNQHLRSFVRSHPEPKDDEGFTVYEYAADRKVGIRTAESRLRSLVACGSLTKGSAKRRDGLGRLVYMAVYRVPNK